MSHDADRPENKRRFPRQEVVIRVNYSTVDDFFSEFATNINEGGIFIETEQLHPVGTLVTLQFQLPECTTPLTVEGRVVWAREADAASFSRMTRKSVGGVGMGVEFETLDWSARNEINRLVRSLRIESAKSSTR